MIRKSVMDMRQPTRFLICLLVLLMFLCSQTALANSNSVTYSYDDAGRLTGVEYPNGSTITYEYDNAGNLLERSVAAAPVYASFDDLINTLTQYLAGFASFDDLINTLTLYLSSN